MPQQEEANLKMAVSIAELKTSLANISVQLTAIAQEMVKLQEGKADAILQRQHSKDIQDLQVRMAQIMTIGAIAMVVVPIIINKIFSTWNP